jgi:hypothetical protein
VQIDFFAVIGVVALGAAYLAYYLRRKRRQELAADGFPARSGVLAGRPVRLPVVSVRVVRQGDGSGTENIMWGVAGDAGA